MANLHHYPCSCRATRPQGSTGGSPSGEGRSVKKICLWHIFSVGRSGYAARKPCSLRGSMWPFKIGHNRKCPPPERPFGYFPDEGKVTRGPGAEPPGLPTSRISRPHPPGERRISPVWGWNPHKLGKEKSPRQQPKDPGGGSPPESSGKTIRTAQRSSPWHPHQCAQRRAPWAGRAWS